MDEGFTIYEKMWEASDSDHPIDMPQAFQVGLFPKTISRRQEKAVELLEDLCRDVPADRAWVDESILFTNLRLADIEAQGVSQFSRMEWARSGSCVTDKGGIDFC